MDVVVLKGALPLNSLHFKELGAVGEEMEQLVLESLRYGAQFSRRKARSSDAVPAENNFGRPPLQLDWELFHRTAKRWADGEISVQGGLRHCGHSAQQLVQICEGSWLCAGQ